MRRRAITAIAVFGNGDKYHLLGSAGDFALYENVLHDIPGASRHGGRMSLRHDEVRRRGKGHSPIKFLANDFRLNGGVIGLENGDESHKLKSKLMRRQHKQGSNWHKAAPRSISFFRRQAPDSNLRRDCGEPRKRRAAVPRRSKAREANDGRRTGGPINRVAAPGDGRTPSRRASLFCPGLLKISFDPHVT
jgi:hypothetical protein